MELDIDKYDEPTLNYLYNYYRELYEGLSRNLDLEIHKVEGYSKVKESLNKRDLLFDSNTLIDLGNGFYINGHIPKFDEVLVSVGGGYYIEKSVDESKQELDHIFEDEKKLINDIEHEKGNIEDLLIKIEYRLNERSR